MKLFLVLWAVSTALFADEVPLTAADLIDSVQPVDAPSSVVLGMGPGIILGEQKTRPGFALELSGRVSDELPLYAGMEWGSFFETGGEFTAVFALLPSVSFLMNQSESVRPMLGISAGVFLSTGNEEDVRLAALLKPGVQFEVSEAISIHFQSKFGLVGPNFVFIPSIGTAFMI